MNLASYLDRNRTIANPGFSRWMVPPAALCSNSVSVRFMRYLILAWGFVGIPLAWGIIETVLNALKLFQKV